MQKRYPALHIISLLFKVLSVVTIIIGIVLMTVVLSQGENYLSFTSLPQIFGTSLLTLGAVPILLFSLVVALILWGVAELLVCVVDIENNTRARATLESQPKETPPAPVAITPPVETPVAQPAPIANQPEESEENKAAAMAQRKQNIKDILNKRLW
jgi:hypothetical protein